MNQYKYPLKGFSPKVVQSYRAISYAGIEYKRRLRINRHNALLIDEILSTYIGHQSAQFVVLDLPDIRKACKILGIEYKPVNTYFCIDSQMCSFSQIPQLKI